MLKKPCHLQVSKINFININRLGIFTSLAQKTSSMPNTLNLLTKGTTYKHTEPQLIPSHGKNIAQQKKNQLKYSSTPYSTYYVELSLCRKAPTLVSHPFMGVIHVGHLQTTQCSLPRFGNLKTPPIHQLAQYFIWKLQPSKDCQCPPKHTTHYERLLAMS